MSDIGGVVFIIGIVGLISSAGALLHSAVKGKDSINPIEVILAFIFFMMMIIGINN